MAGPSVTYTFANSTTADATQVNQNFTDLINGATDGTKDYSINALTCAGTATLNGSVNLGNASGDDLTVSASLASSIPIKTTNSYDIGSSTLGLRALYFGANSQTVNIKGSGSMSATWTLTLPTTAGSNRDVPVNSGSGTIEWETKTKLAITTKSANYTALSTDEVILVSAASSWTLSLPAASGCSGKVLTIHRTDNSPSNTITIDPNASETINGQTTLVVRSQYATYGLYCDGSNWVIVYSNVSYSWSGYHDTSATWARTNTAFGDPSNTGTPAIVERDNNNFGTVTTAASNLPGITFTPPVLGRYRIRANTGLIATGANCQLSARLTDGTNTLDECGSINNGDGSSSSGNPVELDGVYNATTLSSATVKIQIATSAGQGTLREQGAMTQYIGWTIQKI